MLQVVLSSALGATSGPAADGRSRHIVLVMLEHRIVDEIPKVQVAERASRSCAVDGSRWEAVS